METSVTITSINGQPVEQFTGFNPTAPDVLQAEVTYTFPGGSTMTFEGTFTETDDDGMRFMAEWVVTWPGSGPQVSWVLQRVQNVSGLTLGKYHPATVRVLGITEEDAEEITVVIAGAEFELEKYGDAYFLRGGSLQFLNYFEDDGQLKANVFNLHTGQAGVVVVTRELQAELKRSAELLGRTDKHLLHVVVRADSNRDGEIDRDDDAVKRKPVDYLRHGALVLGFREGNRDLEELAIIQVSKLGLVDIPEGLSVTLSIHSDDHYNIDAYKRVILYDRYHENAAALLGPRNGGSVVYTLAGQHDAKIFMGEGTVDFVLEGLEYGLEVILRLEVAIDGKPLSQDEARVMVAPILLTSNLDPVDRLLYSYFPRTSALWNDFTKSIADAGINMGQWERVHAEAMQGGNYIQDAMLFGISALRDEQSNITRQMPVVIDINHKWAPFNEIPRKLHDEGFGYYLSTLDSRKTAQAGGNVIALPSVNGEEYGPIFIGQNLMKDSESNTDFVNLLQRGIQRIYGAQIVEAGMGHIDEFISIIPTEHSFAILVGDFALGRDILRNNDDEEFEHPHLPKMNELLQMYVFEDDNDPDELAFRARDVHIEGMISFLEMSFAVPVIRIPVLRPLPHQITGHTKTSLPNSVNLLVINGKILMPDPFFQPFRDDIEAKLDNLNWINTIVFHRFGGEIHCATNTIRRK